MNRQLALVSLFVLTITLGSCSSGNPSAGLGVYPKAVGAADEGFAIQALRTIATAEAQLKVTRGAYGDFAALTQAGLLDQRFAGSAPNLKGYRFTINASEAAFSGRGRPTGGIMPALSFRTTFSHVAACSPTFVRSTVSSARSPVRSFWLWQVTQYLSRTARGGNGAAADCAEESWLET